MDKNISIEEMKVNILLQESADKVRDINEQFKRAAPQPTPTFPGAPKKDFIQDAHRKILRDNRLYEVQKDTQEKIEKISSTSSIEKQHQYKEKFQDWQINPTKYETPNKDKDQLNKEAKDLLDKADPNFDLKFEFAKNEKMMEREEGATNTTPNYTSYETPTEPSGSGGGGGGGKSRDRDIDRD